MVGLDRFANTLIYLSTQLLNKNCCVRITVLLAVFSSIQRDLITNASLNYGSSTFTVQLEKTNLLVAF